jgi:molecular chaperone GrpE
MMPDDTLPEELDSMAAEAASEPLEEQTDAEKLTAQLAEQNQQYLRLAADFENYRRRQLQEREATLKYAAQSAIEGLLPVLDNLDRAEGSLNESTDPAMLYKSFTMLSGQLLQALDHVGLSKMNPQGELFDPQKHEAVSQQPDSDSPEGTILQVFASGYMLKDKVIRPAQVVVSTIPEVSPQTGDSFEPVENSCNPFQKSVL